MNRLTIPSLLLLVCLIGACGPLPEQYTKLESRVVDVTDIKSILIQVNYGEVIILEAADNHVEVGGQVLFAEGLEYQVRSTGKQLLIKFFTQRAGLADFPLRVEIRIPRQMKVNIQTDSASVSARGYQGDLEVASTSGNITVEQMDGKLTLMSNRGSIVVRESIGMISVVGNYGDLDLQNVHGEMAVSTIMGNVVFDGLIETGDTVRVETDHGSVFINLDPDSTLDIQVLSTNGDVACIVPDISSSTRACNGQIGVGDGKLNIRTVSGAVSLELMP